tara:strand:+ start:46 stop:393 length:348 start_codon:yes stop_codon:yes gene_type:complete
LGDIFGTELMQVKDRYLSQVPRSHYKWAGIREPVTPVTKVWFSPIAREKRKAEIRELKLRREEEKQRQPESSIREEMCQPEPEKVACVQKSEFLLYNSKGKGVKYSRPCRTIIYC